MGKIRVVTLFPDFFKGPLETSLLGRAIESQNLVELIDLRQFGLGKYKAADDRPFGGGAGMVLSPVVCEAALIHAVSNSNTKNFLDNLEKDVQDFQTQVQGMSSVETARFLSATFFKTALSALPPGAHDTESAHDTPAYPALMPFVIALSPQGTLWNAGLSKAFASFIVSHSSVGPASESLTSSPNAKVADQNGDRDLILFCGHYEGFDERFLKTFVHLQVSVGDFVLTGGEPAAALLLDSLIRQIPGVVGKEGSVQEDCFEPETPTLVAGGLRSGQYTRPRVWRGQEVPEVLLSGDHEKIISHRRNESLERTRTKRPDLLAKIFPGQAPKPPAPQKSKSAELPAVYVGLLHHPMVDRQKRVVTTAVTNLDIHDIARSCTTYGVKRFFIIHPSVEQHKVIHQILEHWQDSVQNQYHPARFKALSHVRLVHSFEEAYNEIRLDTEEAQPGPEPLVVMPDARPLGKAMAYEDIGKLWQKNGLTTLAPRLASKKQENTPLFIIFGTGFGIAPEFFPHIDVILEPLKGPTSYNHLSVRAAAAVVLDRMFGNRTSL